MSSWEHYVFNLNHLAFSIWDFIHVFNLLSLCSVHSSWRDRIWQFQDDNNIAFANRSHRNRKKRKNVRLPVEETLKRVKQINNSSSANITASNNQYLHSLATLTLDNNRKLPIASRFLAFFSMCSSLRQLTLCDFQRGTKSGGIGKQSIEYLRATLPHLVTLNLVRSATKDFIDNLEESNDFKDLQQLSIIETNYYNMHDKECLPLVVHKYPNLTNLALLNELGYKDHEMHKEFVDLSEIEQFQRFYCNELYIIFRHREMNVSNLTHLGLQTASFQAMENLALFPFLTHVICYHDSSTNLSPALEKIAQIEKLQYLQVNLHNGYYGNYGQEISLAALEQMFNLVSFAVTGVRWNVNYMITIPVSVRNKLHSVTVVTNYINQRAFFVANGDTLEHFLSDCISLQHFILDQQLYDYLRSKQDVKLAHFAKLPLQVYEPEEIFNKHTLL